MTAYATAPIVLADGNLLAPEGLDRERGIQFLIQDELRAVIPQDQDCTPERVKAAMEFLCDEWLVDVATDYVGKATIIAAALTLIERSLLPDRPCFFITAGRRGNGKTTTIIMLIVAVTGGRPAAAAWSSNEEERRKALMSYFLQGVPYILWDNIPRGMQISCPHIEKSCTAAYYSDRKLGVSEMVCTAASTIHFFTGNNIRARGDLASRSLHIRLDVDRVDPENRAFKHPDPIGWTENHRAEILAALYTILLGNPQLKASRDAEGKTRFKMWWRLVGSAVENAAKLAGQELDFQKLFITQEEDENGLQRGRLEARKPEGCERQRVHDLHELVHVAHRNLLRHGLSVLVQDRLPCAVEPIPTLPPVRVVPGDKGRGDQPWNWFGPVGHRLQSKQPLCLAICQLRGTYVQDHQQTNPNTTQLD